MPTKKSRYLAVLVFILTALFLLYEMALQVAPSVITTELMQEFQVNALGLAILSSCYYYTYTLMQIPAGLLFDRYRSKQLILIALSICIAGIALFAVATTVWQAGFARILIGFGSAFAFVACLVVANEWFAPRHFALLAGIAQLLAALGAMGGQSPLVFATAHLGWRPVMGYLALIGVLIALLIFLVLRNTKARHEQVAATPAVEESFGKSLRLVLRNPQIWFIGLYALIIWAPMTAVASLWGVPYLETVYGFDNHVAATLCSLLWLGVGIGSPALGWWSDQLGRRNIPLAVSAAVGLLAIWVVLYLHPQNVYLVAVALFLVGAGSSGQALSFAVVKEQSEPQHVATAAGFTNMAVVCSGAIFQPLLGWLINHHAGNVVLQHGIPQYSSADYQFAFMVLPLSYVVAMVVSLLLIRETYCQVD